MKNIYNNSPKFGKTLLNFLVLSLLAIVVVLLVNTKHAAAYSTSECGTGSGQLVSGLALGAFDTTTFSTNYDYTDSFYIPPGQSSVTVPWYVQDYNCPVNATSPTEPVFVMGVDATPESPGMTINGTTADQQIYPDFHTPPPPNDSTWGNMNPGTFTDIYSQIQVTFTPSASQLNSCQTYYIQYYPLQTGAPFYTSGDSGFSVCLYQVSGSITAGCDVFGLGDPGVDVDSASNGGIPGYPTLFYFQVGNTNFPLYEVTSLPAAYAIPLSLVNSGPTTVYLYVYQNIAGTWSSAVSTYTIPAACTAPPPPSTINVVAKCTGTNTATATVTMDDYSGAQVNGFYFDTNTAVYYNYYPYPANVTGTAPGPVYIGTVNFTTTSKTTKVRAFFEDGEGQYVPSNNPPPTPITPCLNHPYFQVKGGDISSGSLPGCIGTPEASAGVYGPDGASPTIGSQLAIYALGVISGYASDQQGVTDGNTNLDFANNGPNTPGTFGTVPCMPNDKVLSPCTTAGTPSLDPSATPNNTCFNSDSTTTGSSPTIGNGVTKTIYIKGNLIISSNITYASNWTTPSDIPSLTFVVAGNIYINPSVTQLYGNYFSTGTVYTCPGPGTNVYAGGPACGEGKTPANQLTIFGSIMAHEIALERTYGDITGSNGDDIAPAEVFNYGPGVWLAGLGSTNLNSGYGSITNLPPIL